MICPSSIFTFPKPHLWTDSNQSFSLLCSIFQFVFNSHRRKKSFNKRLLLGSLSSESLSLTEHKANLKKSRSFCVFCSNISQLHSRLNMSSRDQTIFNVFSDVIAIQLQVLCSFMKHLILSNVFC